MRPFDTVALSLTWHTPTQNEHRDTETPLTTLYNVVKRCLRRGWGWETIRSMTPNANTVHSLDTPHDPHAPHVPNDPYAPYAVPNAVSALAAIWLAVALGALDTAIANTALPAIGTDLHSSAAASVWVINAYQMAVVACLLPLAAFSDVVGPKRVFIWGNVVFTVGSLCCLLAPSLVWLALARGLQGIGAAGVMAVNLSLIRLIFLPTQLGRGVGMNAFVVGLGFCMGPTVASLVLSVASWPWLFGINLPVGLLGWYLGTRYIPGRASQAIKRFDVPLAALTGLTFGAFIFTLTSAAQQSDGQVIAASALVTLLAGMALLRRQKGAPAPMFPVDLLSRPLFSLSVLTAIGAFATQGVAFVSLPFYFETVLLRDPIHTGFLMSAWALVVACVGPFAGRLSDRFPPAALGGIGLAFLSMGMLSLKFMPLDASGWEIALRMGLCGLGFGFFQSPNLKAIMSSAPAARSGGASGMVAVARLTGQTTGAALTALCFTLAGTHGSGWALGLGAVTAATAAALSWSRLWAR